LRDRLFGVGYTGVDHLNSDQEEEDAASDSKSRERYPKKLQDNRTRYGEYQQDNERVQRGVTRNRSLVRPINVLYQRDEDERYGNRINENDD
jgi:hypothetical protein